MELAKLTTIQIQFKRVWHTIISDQRICFVRMCVNPMHSMAHTVRVFYIIFVLFHFQMLCGYRTNRERFTVRQYELHRIKNYLQQSCYVEAHTRHLLFFHINRDHACFNNIYECVSA